MKILITGASGQIGQHLSPLLVKAAYELFAPTRRELDITDFANTRSVVATYKPDLVINLAAYTAVDLAESNADLAYAVNSHGAKNIGRASAEVGAPIIHLSTDYVFSGGKRCPYNEEDETFPINVYGKSKLEGERELKKANPNHLILRTAWVFSSKSKNFLTTLLELAKKKDVVAVVNDQVGSPTCAHDVATTTAHLIRHLKHLQDRDWGTYHYAGAPCASWFNMATQIFKTLKRSGVIHPQLVPTTSSQYSSPAKRPANSCLDTQKIITRFHLQPSDWQARLDELVICSLRKIHR